MHDVQFGGNQTVVLDVEAVPQVPVSHSNDVARRKRRRGKEKKK